MRLKYGLLKEILQVKVKQNYGRVFGVQNTIMQSSRGEREEREQERRNVARASPNSLPMYLPAP